MNDILIFNARLITAEGVIEKGWLHSQAGKIVAYGAGDAPKTGAKAIDAEGNTLTAGFIDVHVHGAVGADTMDGNVDALISMSKHFAKTGVTGFAATTLTSPHEAILKALAAIKAAMGKKLQGAAILGAHLEGPYLNVVKTGAQNPDYVRLCSPDEARQYFDSGVLKIVSLAPEFPENWWLIQECQARGITASVAHTNATYAQALAGFDMGIRHSTHTFNAMTGLHHREPGTLGAVLGDNRVNCELIPDGIHVHEGAMKLLWQTKGHEKTILISDAMRAAGLGNGSYKLGELDVTVQDGKASLKDGTLAGSVLAFNEGVRNFMNATGESLEAIWQATSLNAARALGLDAQKGSIAIGKDCDVVLVNENLDIFLTIVGGEVLYQGN